MLSFHQYGTEPLNSESADNKDGKHEALSSTDFTAITQQFKIIIVIF